MPIPAEWLAPSAAAALIGAVSGVLAQMWGRKDRQRELNLKEAEAAAERERQKNATIESVDAKIRSAGDRMMELMIRRLETVETKAAAELAAQRAEHMHALRSLQDDYQRQLDRMQVTVDSCEKHREEERMTLLANAQTIAEMRAELAYLRGRNEKASQPDC